MTTRKQSHSDLLKADFQRIYDEGIAGLPHLSGPFVRVSRWRRLQWWLMRDWNFLWLSLAFLVVGTVPLSMLLAIFGASELMGLACGVLLGQVSLLAALEITENW